MSKLSRATRISMYARCVGISAEAVMQLLREAMTGFLVPELVSRTIFEALGEYGGSVPQRGEDLKTFVEGPLARALILRVDERTQRAVVASLRPILTDIIRSELPPPSAAALAAAPSALPEHDDLPTAPRLTTSQPYVLLVASNRAMEQRLRLAVGPELGASTARTVVDVQAGLIARSPRLVLVDATDPPPLTHDVLARAILRNRLDALVVVWGATRPFARALLAALTDTEPLPIGLHEAEGVEPLLDLVRSHGMAESPSRPPPAPVEPARRAPSAAASRPTPRYGSLTPARRDPGTRG